MGISTVAEVALLQAATQIPFLIAIVVGLWFAIARRGRHPIVSLWAGIGFVALGIQVACRVAVSAYVAGLGTGVIQSTGSLTSFMAFSNLAIYLLFLVGIVALTVAVFVGRQAR